VTLQLQKGAPRQTFEKVLKEFTEGKLKNIINFTQEDVVSSDFNHKPFSLTYDSKASVFMKDNYVKLVGFFDNEWGYTNRLFDLLLKTIGGQQ
jgi:glyceraldehyde 3-phosphate dehydrogenase